MQQRGSYAYIDNVTQEQLLEFEMTYMNTLSFPDDCQHESIQPGTTSGQFLMHHFIEWQNRNRNRNRN